MKNKELSVVAEKSSFNLTVLRIATEAKNSVTQLYPNRVQIFLKQLEKLDEKINKKLALHQINEAKISIFIQFQNNRTINFSSFSEFSNYDLETEMLTESISLRWSFIFDSNCKDEQHLHSIFIKISETPSTGLFLQKILNARTEDLEKPEMDIFSPIACKLDFSDSRFSTELLAVVNEWIGAQSEAETPFGVIKYLRNYRSLITTFISNTFPPLIVLAYVGAWIKFIPHAISNSIKYSSAWVLVGGSVFLIARYLAILMNNFFDKHIKTISLVPLFQITAGDKNKMTKYMAKSQSSLILIAISGLIYGFFKIIGIYLASLIFTTPIN